MKCQRDLEPVGDILVSYEATAMPTDTLDRLAETHLAAVREVKGAELRRNAQILGWLLRIALHKIRALETR
jgi:hypothetical protein